MLVALLRLVLPRRGWQILPEVPLAKEPLRLDVLVVRRLPHAPLPTLLRPEIERFGQFTLVHFISPSDEPQADDAFALLAYGCQFLRLQHRKPTDIQKQTALFVVCSSLTPRYLAALDLLEGRLARVEEGLWQGALAGFRLEVVETAHREKYPGEVLWRTLSKKFLDDPVGGRLLTEEEIAVCRQLNLHVQRFEKEGDGLMASEVQKIAKGYREALKRWMQDCLPVEDRLAGLAPEQRLAGLAPEQRLAGLAPEQRLAGLAPEHIVLALPDEVLRGLSSEYLATLPKDVQATIAARLKKTKLAKKATPRRSPRRSTR
jgi:hypothetical protein